jgi:hypothetical protein
MTQGVVSSGSWPRSTTTAAVAPWRRGDHQQRDQQASRARDHHGDGAMLPNEVPGGSLRLPLMGSDLVFSA